MEDGAIIDAQITASSQVDDNHSAVQARLNFKADGSKAGAWSALTNDRNQWLQVDLGSYTRVTRIATQGRNGYNEWVTKYNLQYSDDEGNFQLYKQIGESVAKVMSPAAELLSCFTSMKHNRSIPCIAIILRNVLRANT